MFALCSRFLSRSPLRFRSCVLRFSPCFCLLYLSHSRLRFRSCVLRFPLSVFFRARVCVSQVCFLFPPVFQLCVCVCALSCSLVFLVFLAVFPCVVFCYGDSGLGWCAFVVIRLCLIRLVRLLLLVFCAPSFSSFSPLPFLFLLFLCVFL